MWLPEIEIEIRIPTTPFRIHPDPERKTGPLLCAYNEDRWWLAHPEGIEPEKLGGAFWVELFEGIDLSGLPFLMPVFRHHRATDPCCRNFLAHAVKLGRSAWISIEGELYATDCRIVRAPSSLPDPPPWKTWLLPDLVDNAFGGRYIGSWRDVAVHLCHVREYKTYVARADFHYWMRAQFDPDDTQLDSDRSPELD